MLSDNLAKAHCIFTLDEFFRQGWTQNIQLLRQDHFGISITFNNNNNLNTILSKSAFLSSSLLLLQVGHLNKTQGLLVKPHLLFEENTHFLVLKVFLCI